MRAPFHHHFAAVRRFSSAVGGCLAATGLKDSIRFLILRRHLGYSITPDSIVSILKHSSCAETLIHGRQLHAHMIVSASHTDPFVLNHLIHMYGKCGALDDACSVFRLMDNIKNSHSYNTLINSYCKFGFLAEARNVFDEMPLKDSVSWNTMISGYDRFGPCEEALAMFVRMRWAQCRVDHYGVSSVISACSNLRFLGNGRELHGFSVKIGLDLHVQVGSALIGLYVSCEEIEYARRSFDEMDVREQFTWNSMLSGYVQCSRIEEAIKFFGQMAEKNIVSWTTMVAGCSRHDRSQEAIGFFYEMRGAGLKPDQMCFVSALNACIQALDFVEGFQIHGQIVRSGFDSNVFVRSVIVALYAKCGCLDSARSVIDQMEFVDDFSLSVIITEYAKHGLTDKARELFETLKVKSVPLWNALIGGYSELGLDREAFYTFTQMQMDGITADEFTFGSLMLGADLLGVRYGEQLHSAAIKVGVDSSVFVGSALVDMYSYFLRCEDAVSAFNVIDEPNLVSWNAMISGYSYNNMNNEVIHTLCLMMILGMKPDNITLSLVLDSCSGLSFLAVSMVVHALAYKLGLVLDVVVGTALIDMYAKCENMDCASHAFSEINEHNVVSWTAFLGGYVKCGMWDKAMEVFRAMPVRNVVSWNTMLSGRAKYGSGLEALQLYSEMSRYGGFPDHITFISLLTICCRHLLIMPGKQVHAQAVKTGHYMNKQVCILLNEMYQMLGICSDKLGLKCSDQQKVGNVADMTEQDVLAGG